jgi:hypothetical protein
MPEPAGRRVIDISGDGMANFGAPPATVRDQLVSRGITINGLAIPLGDALCGTGPGYWLQALGTLLILMGTLGLLLSTPLTVCLAVLGKSVPGLGFFATLLGEEPPLEPDVRFYQRLLDNFPKSQMVDFACNGLGEIAYQKKDYARALRVFTVDGAEEALLFSSGVAALSAIFLSHLRSGDHAVALHQSYGGTHDLLRWGVERFGWRVDFVDAREPESWERVFRPETRLLHLESPTNPTLCVVDIERAARLAHARGAVLTVDNTFASPVGQKPLALGADLVMYSATKSIGGHADLLAGAVVGDAPYFDRFFVGEQVPLLVVFRTWFFLGGGGKDLVLPAEMEKARLMARGAFPTLNRQKFFSEMLPVAELGGLGLGKTGA